MTKTLLAIALLLLSGCAVRHADGSVDSLVAAYASESVSFVGIGWVRNYGDGETHSVTSGLTAGWRPTMRASFDVLGVRDAVSVPVGEGAVEDGQR